MARDSAFAPNKIFREIRWEVLKVFAVNELLNAAVLFFALNIVLTLFNMSFLISAFIAVAFLVYRVTRAWRKSVLKELEEGNPEVHEILRTAYEYQSERSLMAQGLLYDLQRRLSTVSAGVLLDPRKLAGKIIAIALLAFVPVAIISFTPQLIQQNPVQDVDFSRYFGNESDEAFGELMGVALNRSQADTGADDIVQLGNRKLDLEVASGGSQVSFEEVSDPEDKSFKYNDYPVSPEAAEAEYDEGADYDEGDVELINTYSCRTRGTC